MQDIWKYLPFALAAVAAVLAIVSYWRDRRFERRGMTSVGGIVGWKTERTRQGHLYYPEIDFSTADGQAIRFVSRFGSNQIPVLAQTVSVLYDPARPHQAEMKHVIKTDMRATIFGLAAVFLVVFGVMKWS